MIPTSKQLLELMIPVWKNLPQIIPVKVIHSSESDYLVGVSALYKSPSITMENMWNNYTHWPL